MGRNKVIAVIIALVLVLSLLGYTGYGFYVKQTYHPKNPVVTMDIKDYGTVKMELYPDMAPDTVRNFIKLVNQGFYNGLVFHRVEADKLIQGGDPKGDGSGTNDQSVRGEFAANGDKNNTLSFTAGTIRFSKTGFFSVCFNRFKCNKKRL